MKKLIYGILVLALFSSCKKFLEEKSDKALAIPETLADLQALLDHYQILVNVDGTAAEISSNDYYLTDADFQAQNEEIKNMYTWQRNNVFIPNSLNDWFYNYRAIYRANSVLGLLESIERTGNNAAQWNLIKGQAHFFRAKNNLKNLSLWAKAYDEATASTDLGIPLREGTDFNKVSVRASVKEGYDLVVSDLKTAINKLTVGSVHVTRPSKIAAYGLLARTYLAMRRYPQALKYADSCLQLKNDLIDFNTLNAASTYPISRFNTEVIQESFFGTSLLDNNKAKIAPDLYAQYEDNDLRKVVFFKDNKNGTYGFKGSYEGAVTLFSGIAVSEILLIRAECFARNNQQDLALTDLNYLLKNRYKKGEFEVRNVTTQAALLTMILKERRKELLMRGLRWSDVKRLNKEGADISFTRIVNGKTYTILANSNNFELPIPDDVISLTEIKQNP